MLIRGVLTGVAFAGLVFIWGFLGWNFGGLPATIPMHFDAAGVPTGFGAKSGVLVVAGIANLMFVLLALVQRVDCRWYNYPFRLRADARATACEYSRTLVAASNVVAMAVFAILEVAMVSGARDRHLSGVLALNWVVLGVFLVAFAAYVAALVPFRERG